ncbi:ABC transporter substrate-binding protein [Brevibacterium album]|uniref:ABC transporter substrate-binding protein n=1 Tax=Brevibacterium album TaxID=417948 RepID=UPI0004172655|nr:ABC transporter substrate-binding protein [Brevibacterium album]
MIHPSPARTSAGPRTCPRTGPRTLAAAALTAGLLALSACGGTPAGEDARAGEAGTEGTRTVSTVNGEVEVPADAQRIVVLNYALAGYLYDMDVPVAATIPEDADRGNQEFSPLWGEAPEEDGTEFLPWSADGFDLEAILEAEPDLIIAGGWGFPSFHAEAAYDDLSAIAPTVVVDKALPDWQGQAEFLATEVFNRPEAFEEMAAEYEARLGEVREVIEVPEQPTSFVSVTGEGTPYLVLEDQGLPLMFDALGFETNDIAARNELEPYQPGGDLAELSTEQLGQLVDSETLFVMGFNADTASVEALKDEPAWSGLPAFADEHAHDLPYWALRHDFDESLELLDLVEEEFGR